MNGEYISLPAQLIYTQWKEKLSEFFMTMYLVSCETLKHVT